LLGKRPNGELAPWSLVVNGPFLLFGLVSMRAWHLLAHGPPWHEVSPGVWIGRRPTRRDRAAWRELAPTAIVDLCAELPATRVRSGAEAYLPLPVLDAQAPTDDQLERALTFIDAHRDGRVFVHCALGHSRSATVIAAWLIAGGHPGPVEVVVAELAARRAGIALTPPQAERLRAWSSRRGQRTAAHG
jgi:protein-tyrosine phosphatase